MGCGYILNLSLCLSNYFSHILVDLELHKVCGYYNLRHNAEHIS